MSSITNNEIRYRMLEILSNLAQREPGAMLNRQTMQNMLQISEGEMDFNMLYLEEKGLVKLHKTMGALWQAAEIRAFGIDVIENKEKYSERFPFIQTTIQEIHGNVYGPAIQAVGSNINYNQNVTTAFQQARKMTEAKADITASLKSEVEKYLNLLEEELKSKEPDAGKIQKFWKWLKRNANWVVPTLAKVVLEGVKIALGD